MSKYGNINFSAGNIIDALILFLLINLFNMMVFLEGVTVILVIRPWPIMLQFLIIYILLSSAQKSNPLCSTLYTAIMPQFLCNLITFIDCIKY